MSLEIWWTHDQMYKMLYKVLDDIRCLYEVLDDA